MTLTRRNKGVKGLPHASQKYARCTVGQSSTCRSLRLVILAILSLISTRLSLGSAFLQEHCISQSVTRRKLFGDIVPVRAVPLSRFRRDMQFFLEDQSFRRRFNEEGILSIGDEMFQLGLVQEDDLPDLSRFVVAAFGADAIRLSQDVNAFERMLLSPATELLNGYSNLVAFAEVFQGTKQRLKSRFEKMDLSAPNTRGLSVKEAIAVVERDSLVLVVARPSKDTDVQTQIIASIELRLQVSRFRTPV